MMPLLRLHLRRTARALALSGLVLLSGPACKRNQSSDTPALEELDAGAVASGSRHVRVLTDGAGEKRVLRYQIADKQADSMALDLKVTLSVERVLVEPHRVELPSVRVVFASERLPGARPKPKDEGDVPFAVKTELREARFAGVEGVSADLLKSTGEELKSLNGGTSRGSMIPQGFRAHEPFQFAAAGGPNRAQIAEALKLALEHLSPPFPDQPVGVGARWEVSNRSKVGGVEVAETVVYELVDLTEFAGVIRTNITQNALPQKTRLPGLPEAASAAELVALEGQGSGEIEFDLRSLSPLGGRITVQDSFDYRQKDAGDRGAFRLRSSVTLTAEKL